MPVTLSLRSGFRYYFDDTPGLTPRAIKRTALTGSKFRRLRLLDKLGFVLQLNYATASFLSFHHVSWF
jgi:hypothetical protein